MTTGHGLSVEGARVHFRGADSPALDDVSVTLPRGRVLAVLGPSGCGKSTLLRAVAGLQPLDAGMVAFDGQNLARVPTHKRDFALMFQDGQLFGHMDVAANVGYALARRGVGRVERAARVGELLELVGLPGYESRSPATLSGGQQQRVALARALAATPRLLLLDEPLSALDRALRERLAGELRVILSAEGVTALFVTHDHAEALTVADDMAVMRAGRIVQNGEAREVWRRPSDPETAEFLGFTTALDAAEAARLGLPPQRWSLRRSAIRVVGPDRARGAAHRVEARVTMDGGAGAIHDLSGSSPVGGAEHHTFEAVVAQASVADEATHVGVTLDALPNRVLAGVAYPGELDVSTLAAGERVSVVVDASQAVSFAA